MATIETVIELIKPENMTTSNIEKALTFYGVTTKQFAEWNDDIAHRVGELLIEWSKR